MQASPDIAVERVFGPEAAPGEKATTACDCTCACVNQPAGNMTPDYSQRQSKGSVAAIDPATEGETNLIGDMKALRWW